MGGMLPLFFPAFLRAGEMTTPDEGGYDPAVHLSFGDVVIDDPLQPSFVRLTLKQSKTDPFRKGVDLYVGRTGSNHCPVAAPLSCIHCRGSTAGRPLTRKHFVELVQAALAQTESGNTAAIVSATTAAAKGIEECHQDLGQMGESGILTICSPPEGAAYWLC